MGTKQWLAIGLVSMLCTLTQAEDRLQQAMSEKMPPAWWDSVKPTWDVSKPWKDGRIEIRRLLAGKEDEVRQAVKLTWMYKQKKDINDGHEWPMYLFMSGNYAWAVQEFPGYLKTVKGKGPTHAYLNYASSIAHFGAYDKALSVLNDAMNDLPPAPWNIPNTANIHNHMGDVYARMGNIDKAKENYARSMELFPQSKQPYGRQNIPRNIAKIKAKIDMLTMQSLAAGNLRNGTYTGKTLGYSDKTDLVVTVTIADGKITDVKVKHEEKIDLGATELIPRAILEKQTLKVDIITGATVTCQAIIDGALQALRQAGLK